MIKHEEVRKKIFFVPKDEILLQTYIAEQEKKDELLELYRELVYTRNKDDYNNKWDKIKAIEEALK